VLKLPIAAWNIMSNPQRAVGRIEFKSQFPTGVSRLVFLERYSLKFRFSGQICRAASAEIHIPDDAVLTDDHIMA